MNSSQSALSTGISAGQSVYRWPSSIVGPSISPGASRESSSSDRELSRGSQQSCPTSTASSATSQSGEVGQLEPQRAQDGGSARMASLTHCSETGSGREASEATAANTDGVKDILSRYEAYMAGQRERHGQGHLVPDDGDTSPPSQPNDRDSQPPVHDDSVAGRNPSDGQPQETLPSNKTLGGKRHGQAAAGRVRKKRASTRRGQEYEFLRLGGVRRQGRKTQYKVFWAPTWMTLADLRGQRAFEEAGDLVTKEFGRDEWEKEARAAGFREAFNMDSEIEYASE